MAEKIKKISVNAFEKASGSYVPKMKNVDWNGITISVKERLRIGDVIDFVDSVVKICFHPETAEYIPEVKDYAIRDGVVRFYTNISLPAKVETRYDLVYGSDIVDFIKGSIDQEQFLVVIKAIEEKIDYIVSEKAGIVSKQITEVYSALDGLRDQFENLFGEVSSDDIQKIADAVLGGALDEEKLVGAVMKMNSEKSDEV